MFKKLAGVLVCASVLAACNLTDEQLSVGEYDAENNVIFSEDVITNEGDITQFKSIVTEAENTGNRPDNIPSEEPAHIVKIDNPSESTLIMYVSIWSIDNTFIISRGFNNDTESFLLLDADLSKQLNDILMGD